MGRHEFLLNCSTDGPIRDAERARARALDALAPVQPAPVAIGAVRLKPRAIVARMSRVIAEAAPKRASVHLADFERAGITRSEAERHFAAALSRARLIEPAIDRLDQAAA